jgi:3-hydroxyacyl-CoA dehydrogenase
MFLRSLLFSSANLQSFVRKGRLTKLDYEKKLSLLSGVLDYEQFRDADVVIEVKFNIFTFLLVMQLDQHCLLFSR